MWAKIKSASKVFAAGNKIADHVALNKAKITVGLTGLLGALFVALLELAKSFGYDWGITNVQVTDLSYAIVAILGFALSFGTAAASKDASLNVFKSKRE